MRSGWCNLLGAVWLLAAAIHAPLAHFHPGDLPHRHAQGFAHPHEPTHADDATDPEIESGHDDEKAVWLEWASATPQRLTVADAAIPEASLVTPAFVRVGRAAEFAPRSHDPPAHRDRPARAPPV
jgi:hypothetical protein